MAFPVNYKYKAKLTIVTRPSSTLSNFPVLLNKDNLPSDMLDADGVRPALEGGGDIRFSSDSAGATQLACEVCQFVRDNTPANGKAEIWAKIPTVSNTVDTEFWVWWGGPDTTQPARNTAYGLENVWDSNFKAVWHLSEAWNGNSQNFKDSTANLKHGTRYKAYGSTTVSTDGKWGGKCIDFQGSSLFSSNGNVIEVDGSGTLNFTSTLTVEYWQTWNSYSGEDNDIWAVGKANSEGEDWKLRGLGMKAISGGGSNGKIWWNTTAGDEDNQSTNSYARDTWMHVAAAITNSSSMALAYYVNGAADGTTTPGGTPTGGTRHFTMGEGTENEYHRGKLDEVRISSTARSAAWIAATYATANNPATYITEGTVSQLAYPSGIASGEAFGTAKVNRSIVGTGTISAEQFGTPVVSRGNVNVSPTGITSVQAFGTAKLNLSVSTSGIASGQALGTPMLNLTIYMTGIASTQTFGTTKLNLNITGAGGIATTEAIGTAQINNGIAVAGIASGEAFGTPVVIFIRSIYPANIASGEAFGTPAIGAMLYPSGIVSIEAFGTSRIGLILLPLGISSGETFGIAKLNLRIVFVGGIGTGEAFGNLTTKYKIEPYGIPTLEAFGTAKVNRDLVVAGIASEEAVGSPILRGWIQASGITSTEAFGALAVLPGSVNISPSGIPSGEACGAVRIVRYLLPSGIATAEALGAPVVSEQVRPQGIASGEAFGTTTMGLKLIPAGIVSGEAFGDIGIFFQIRAEGIISGEAFGNPNINFIIHCTGIVSGEAFGTATTIRKLMPIGIGSGEAFGTATMVWIITPYEIASREAFGALQVLRGNVSVSPSGIVSREAFGVVVIGTRIDFYGILSEERFGIPTIYHQEFITGVGAISSTENFGNAIVFYEQFIEINSGIGSVESFGAPVLTIIKQNLFFDYVQNDLEQGMLNTEEMGETGIYIFANGEIVQIPGIFDNEYRTVDPDTGVGIMTSQPVFWCSSRLFKLKPGLKDKMRIRGVNYQVIRHEPDGTGLSMLYLHQGKTV